MFVPQLGKKAHLRPSHPTYRIQVADDVFGRFIPPDGEVRVVDRSHWGRIKDGSLIASDPETKSPAKPAEKVGK